MSLFSTEQTPVHGGAALTAHSQWALRNTVQDMHFPLKWDVHRYFPDNEYPQKVVVFLQS